MRVEDNVPVLDTSVLANKHHDPVWELQWVETTQAQDGEEKTTAAKETLVSVSTDGRVSQWNIKKGMESTDLIALKHVQPSDAGQKSKDSSKTSFVSRLNGGLSLDFNPDDSNMYVAVVRELVALADDTHIRTCLYSQLSYCP